MEKPYPRRRDVRRLLLQLSDLLDRYGIVDDPDVDIVPYADFDREFLSELRDMMRDGMTLGEALDAFHQPAPQVPQLPTPIAPDFPELMVTGVGSYPAERNYPF